MKRTLKRLLSCVIWPNINRDVINHVRQCGPCQKHSKYHKSKAPLHPLPIVGRPFQRIAFDLVGPYPRTKRNYKYLPTCICYFSRYPEAIPLRNVDECSVASAMVEVFSRTGIPSEILTDQGSVFVGKLMKQMCQLLNITPIKTSPYHPETDGLLERWHADLLSMLKKATTDKRDWDLYLPYVLFAYRQTPHTVTGFSPFQLIYGHNVRGPLEVLRDNWIDGNTIESNLVEWVQQLKSNMADFAVIAGDRTALAKAKMKSYYNKTAKPSIDFAIGSMVLVRIPGLSSRFDDSWSGPYEILRQVTPVTWEISIPNSSKKNKRIVHSNRLKQWHTSEAKVGRVVSAVEDDDVEVPCVDTPVVRLSDYHNQWLQELFSKFDSVITDSVGSTSILVHAIDTGDTKPFRKPPYRHPAVVMEGIKTALDALLKDKIIEPSHYLWSSPLLPVLKKDKTIRICIDFRTLNSFTVPDPYLMPRIDNIIVSLGSACFLSKMDLQMGFHQVPLRLEDKPKTAFCTPWGKYKYRYMPFGLRNAPATFYRLMDILLNDILVYSRAYMDDIVVFSSDWDLHCLHLTSVLQKLCDAGLMVKLPKCEWAVASCNYLGFVVGSGKRRPEDCKIAMIKAFP